MTALRPIVPCPVCGASRVPCRPTPKGYVLTQHNAPRASGQYWSERCTATAHPVTADAVLAWVAEEGRSVDGLVAYAESEVTRAQEHLASTQAEAREARSQLEKIAAKARKVVSGV